MSYRIQIGGPIIRRVGTVRVYLGIQWWTQEFAHTSGWALHRLREIANDMPEDAPLSLRVLDPDGREVWSADHVPGHAVATLDPDLIPF